MNYIFKNQTIRNFRF